jgi:hypothetical protein
MNKREVEVKPLALKNISEAYLWYEEHQKGLGEDFLDEWESVANHLASYAETYQKSYKDFRQVLLKRFPFVVVYEIEKRKVIIYNMINTKRNIKKRFKKI